MSLYASRTAADAAAEQIKLYAQPQRLMILSCLVSGERTVSEIDEATGIGQPALSQQLAELRRADIVKTRRESKQIYYRLADEAALTRVRALEALFGADETAGRALATALAGAPKAASQRPAGAAVFARIFGR
jgi:DNA-binding transcriptional ArsR family regulator